MKILFLSAEVAPFVSVGGLSQVMYYLPRALAKRGHDVRIFTPGYGSMDQDVLRKRRWKAEGSWTFAVPTAMEGQPKGEDAPTDDIPCEVRGYRPSDKNAWIYLLDGNRVIATLIPPQVMRCRAP